MGGISTLFGDFIRHIRVFLVFINLAMVPFLFLAFAGPDGGSIALLFFLIFSVVLLTPHLYLSWVLQAAAFSLSCCFLLTWTVWKLWAFLDEAKARYQNRLETNIVLQYCPLRGQKRKQHNSALHSWALSGYITQWRASHGAYCSHPIYVKDLPCLNRVRGLP